METIDFETGLSPFTSGSVHGSFTLTAIGTNWATTNTGGGTPDNFASSTVGNSFTLTLTSGGTFNLDSFEAWNPNSASNATVRITTGSTSEAFTVNTIGTGAGNVVNPTTAFENVSSVTFTVQSASTASPLNFAGVDDIVLSNIVPAAANTAPSFNDGATAALAVAEDAVNISINDLLDVSDVDASQTLTWSIQTGPASGTLGGFTDTATSGSAAITPSGLTYTPNANATGADSFVIRVSDGTDTDDITVNVTIDAAPTVTSFTPITGSPTNSDTVQYQVVFSESVTGVDASDFGLTGSTATATGVAGSGTTYTVTFGGGDLAGLTGDVTATLTDDDTIVNGSGTALGGVGTTGDGDGSATGSAAITMDNTPPTTPTIAGIITDSGSSAIDALTNNRNLSFFGTGEFGDIVTVTLSGGGVIGTATVSSANTWIFVYNSVTLTEGFYTVDAAVSAGVGNTANATQFAFEIDLTGPVAPSIDLVDASDSGSSNSDDLTNNTTPTFEGTTEANAIVEVFVDGASQGTVTADGTGVWSLPISTPLTEGVRAITAQATDEAGNAGAISVALNVTVDVTAPAIGTPDLGSASDTGSSNSDDVTNNTTPSIIGSTEANAVVEIFVDGASQGTTSANGSGDWSFAISTPLTEGDRAITATSTDAAGNTSAVSSSLTVTVDLTPPAITVPDLAAASDSGAFDDDNITNVTTPTFEGTTEANAIVEVFIDGGSVGTVTANGSGAWSFTSTALAEGDHTVAATFTDIADNTSARSATLSFNIDTTPPVLNMTPTTPINEASGPGLDVASFAPVDVNDVIYSLSDDGNGLFAANNDDNVIEIGQNGGPDVDVVGASDDFTVVVTDLAGNATSETTTIAFTDVTEFAGSTSGADIMLGTAAVELFQGQAGKDIILGRAGDDYAEGGFGDDIIYGDEGLDTLVGGGGKDVLFGGDDNDIMFGGTGSDFLDGGANDDTMWGGDDNDTLRGGEGVDTMDGGEGRDYLQGEAGADILNGGIGKDTLNGGADADVFVFSDGGNRDVILDFETGTDIMRIEAAAGDGGLTAAGIVAGACLISGGTATLLDFGDGDRIILRDITSVTTADFEIV